MKKLISGVLFLFILGFVTPSVLHCKESIQSSQNEAGFVHIEPQTFYFHYGSYFSRLLHQSSEALIWYSFHQADQNYDQKPLFVFFNGGPGSASSSGLMSMYTTRYTLDNSISSGGGDAYIPNSVSWTRLGNLLYIDARQTGYSYNRMQRVNDFDARFREFNSQNFNPFTDAADFIRVLLRFLDAHPELKRNPVVIVGESYGGMRALVMLHLLLNYTEYGNGQEMYQDSALADDIQAHLDDVFPQFRGQRVPPEIIASQFGYQILVQPALTFDYQSQITDEMILAPGSVIDQIEQEVGIPYDPNAHGDPLSYVMYTAGRDPYIYTKPRDWLSGFFRNAARLLRFTLNMSQITGVDVTQISQLYASSRADAYRIFDTDIDFGLIPADTSSRLKFLFLDPARLEAEDASQETGDLSAVFGTLQAWDKYFLSTNFHANWAFHVLNVAKVRGYEVDMGNPRFGEMFLKNVAHVNTFITNAALDLVVYTAAIPPSLARHTDILESARHVKGSPQGEIRSGQIVLRYRSSAFPDIQGLDTRIIRFPLYSSSCHAVSLTQPMDFFHDVSQWLDDIGVDVGLPE
jgi:pimeloyl-ACP methyl ester carboxylesterase